MKIEIEISEDLKKAISGLATAYNLPLKKTIGLMLIGDVARKAAWGDLLDVPEPGIEYVKTKTGDLLEGSDLYKNIYQQMNIWINNLMLGEKLLETIVKENENLKTKDNGLNNVLDHFKGRKEYAN